MKDGLWVDVCDNIADLYFAVLGSYTPWNYLNNKARIFKRLGSLGIDSQESIPPAYEARRAGTIKVPALAAQLWVTIC
jgi:hypothetical protein